MADLGDLIKRCESAEAGEQHSVLLAALGLAESKGWLRADDLEWGRSCCGIGAYESAAMLLVPEGFHYRMEQVPTDEGMVCLGAFDFGKEITAATPALALTAACLKARQAKEADNA